MKSLCFLLVLEAGDKVIGTAEVIRLALTLWPYPMTDPEVQQNARITVSSVTRHAMLAGQHADEFIHDLRADHRVPSHDG